MCLCWFFPFYFFFIVVVGVAQSQILSPSPSASGPYFPVAMPIDFFGQIRLRYDYIKNNTYVYSTPTLSCRTHRNWTPKKFATLWAIFQNWIFVFVPRFVCDLIVTIAMVSGMEIQVHLPISQNAHPFFYWDFSFFYLQVFYVINQVTSSFNTKLIGFSFSDS